VSSPGLDRVLRTPAHFERFVGERVRVELKVARAGRRRYTGRLDTVGATGVEITVDGEAVALSFAEIGRARLVPVWRDPPGRR
jgi:ribosome maturation factor RimP